MSTRATLDVSHLPATTFDTRAPLWWGNLLLLFIETTMFGLLVAVYFYLRTNFEEWPPPRVDRLRFIHNPVPDLFYPTVNLALLVGSCLPMIWVDRAARRHDKRAVQIGLLICLLLGLASIALRAFEFGALQFKWNDNAYASIIWSVLGMHLLHLITMTGEVFILTTWVFLRELDEKHALDITVTAVYWYWVVGVWLPLYVLVFWGPRFL